MWLLFEDWYDNRCQEVSILGLFDTSEEVWTAIHQLFRKDKVSLDSIEMSADDVDTAKIGIVEDEDRIIGYYTSPPRPSDYVLVAKRINVGDFKIRS